MNEAVIAILAAVVGAILSAALGVLAWAALRLFRDIKGVSIKQNDLIGCLIRGEDLNPAERRRELTMIGKRK